MNPHNDPVIEHFRDKLHKLYGSRAAHILLYGSRARGDAHPDSDYDVAVFLRNYGGLWNELGKVAPLIFDIGVKMDACVSIKPLPESAYNNQTLFMHEVRREGIPL